MIQVHSGSCKAPCEGMEDLGAFEAFNLRATNNGLVLSKNITKQKVIVWSYDQVNNNGMYEATNNDLILSKM